MIKQPHSFDSAVIGQNGLIYKAGFQSADETASGVGVDDTDTTWFSAEGAATFSYTTGGIKKTSTEDDAAGFQLSIPAAIQSAINGRYEIQFDIKLSDFTSRYGETFTNAFFVRFDPSPRDTITFDVQTPATPATDYHMAATATDGSLVFPNPVAWKQGDSRLGLITPFAILHDNIKTDEAGFATVSISHRKDIVEWRLNGEPWLQYHKNLTLGDTATTAILMQERLSFTMRNLLIYDRPLPKLSKGNIRINFLTHSFGSRTYLQSIRQGGIASENRLACSTDDWYPSLYKALPFDFEWSTMCDGGNTLSNIYNNIVTVGGDFATLSDTANTVTAGAKEWEVTRHRPHFCILIPFWNGVGTFASFAEAIHTITDALMTRNIIPIWCTEYNTAFEDKTADHTEIMAELERQQAVNDIGIADTWLDFPDGVCPTTHLYNTGTAGEDIHPNAKAQSIMMKTIAKEIMRLKQSPPAYSRLSTSSDPEVIAAP